MALKQGHPANRREEKWYQTLLVPEIEMVKSFALE
jgi:hypothetical protein